LLAQVHQALAPPPPLSTALTNPRARALVIKRPAIACARGHHRRCAQALCQDADRVFKSTVKEDRDFNEFQQQREKLNYFWIVEKKGVEDRKAELRNKERELQVHVYACVYMYIYTSYLYMCCTHSRTFLPAYRTQHAERYGRLNAPFEVQLQYILVLQ
jgi:hypothetical protein